MAIPDIPEEFKKRYWLDKPGGADTMSGKQAYEEYLHRQLAGPSTKDDGSASAADDLPPGAEDLIQYNIESVQALFCDDLSNYWKQVLDSPRVKNSREAMVRPQTDYAKKPEGAGWIIEVQGYTYHRDAETFVRTTLLENLARLGNPTPPKADAPAGRAPAAPAPTAPGPGQPRAGEAAPASNMGPVINHISHVVLYQYQRSSAKGPLELLGSNVHSQVRTMALTAAPAAGGGTLGGQPSGMMGGQPSGMMGGSPNQGGGADKPAPTGPSRDTWTPLGEAAAASGAGRGAQFPAHRPRVTNRPPCRPAVLRGCPAPVRPAALNQPPRPPTRKAVRSGRSSSFCSSGRSRLFPTACAARRSPSEAPAVRRSALRPARTRSSPPRRALGVTAADATSREETKASFHEPTRSTRSEAIFLNHPAKGTGHETR